MVSALLGGTFQPTERTKRLARILRLALNRIGMTLDQAASEQGIDAAQFNRQLVGYLGQTPSAYRLAELPDSFHRERLKLEGPCYGLIVLDSDQVGAAVELMARTAGKLRMAQMDLVPEQLKKKEVS